MNAPLRRLLLLVALGFTGLMVLPNGPPTSDESWRNHPALAETDGKSHRGDKMVAAEIDDPRVLDELSRRFRRMKTLRWVGQGNTARLDGESDFEDRQEYLLRLLDYYWFSKQRLIGKTRQEVERIFGPLHSSPGGMLEVQGGRDTFCIYFTDGRVHGAFYAMGF